MTIAFASDINKRRNVSQIYNPSTLPAGQIRTDPFASSLFTAMTFSNYKSDVTGGPYVDVTPKIQQVSGVSQSAAKTLANIGNGTISAESAAPNPNYTTALNLVNASSTSDLIYYSESLSSNQNLTVEGWMFMPTSTTVGIAYFQTNNFSGGYYQGWQAYVDSDLSINYFTNYANSVSTSNNPFVKNQWNHVAWVFTSGNLKIYYNGTEVASSTGNGASSQSTLAIGGTSWDGLGWGPSRGGIKFLDFRIYTAAKYTSSFTVDINDTSKAGSIIS